MTGELHPDRHALLELAALLGQIAAGNEAFAYATPTGQPGRADRTWANLYDLPNHLAHSRLPDIDEAWRLSSTGQPVTCWAAHPGRLARVR